jgi:hypothetical protein
MQQAALTNFLLNQPLPASYVQTEYCLKSKFGRPSQSLSSSELKEAISYYSASPAEQKRLLSLFGKRKLKHALAICKLDMGRRGVIYRTVCPTHGRAGLLYNWDNKEGVRVRCKAPNCNFNTHFMPFMFQQDLPIEE